MTRYADHPRTPVSSQRIAEIRAAFKQILVDDLHDLASREVMQTLERSYQDLAQGEFPRFDDARWFVMISHCLGGLAAAINDPDDADLGIRHGAVMLAAHALLLAQLADQSIQQREAARREQDNDFCEEPPF
jgi:hypothetical protein